MSEGENGWSVEEDGSEQTETDGETPDGDDSGESSGGSSTVAGILVALLIGGAMVYGGYTLQASQPGPGSTVTTNATVLGSDYTQRGTGSDREFSVDVTYEYEFEGQNYTSSNVRAGPSGHTVDKETTAETLVEDQFAEGNVVEAHVDPEDPETAYLLEYRRGDRLEETIGHYILIGIGSLLLLASVSAIIKKGRQSL